MGQIPFWFNRPRRQSAICWTSWVPGEANCWDLSREGKTVTPKPGRAVHRGSSDKLMPQENCSPASGAARGHAQPVVLKSLVGAAGTLAVESGRGNPAILSPHNFDPVIHPLSGSPLPSVTYAACVPWISCGPCETWADGSPGRRVLRKDKRASMHTGVSPGRHPAPLCLDLPCEPESPCPSPPPCL